MNPMKETGKKKIKSNVKRYLSCFLILFLVVCSLHIYGGSVLAATSGASSDVDSVIDSIPGLAAGKNGMLSSIETHLGNLSSVRCTIFKVGQYWQGSLVRYKCQCYLTLGNLFYVNGNLYSDAESDVLYYTAFSNASTTSESTFVFAGTSTLMLGDKELFLVASPNSEILDPFTNSDSVCWTSDECFINPDLIYRNLDISDYVPDTRVLNATKVDLYGTEYIEVVTSDVYLSDYSTIASVTISGYASNVAFSYTFLRSQFIDITIDNPYAFFYLDPNDIPYKSVDITGLTYRSDSSLWLPGDKTIPVNFSFGLPEYEYSTDVTNITNNSYYIDTYDPTFNPGHGRIWHEVFIRANISSAASFWDEELVLCQPFKFSFIFLPLLPQNSVGYFDYLYDCADYYYDVVIFNTPETLFDAVYGAGAFQNYRSTFDATNIYQFNETWYGYHPVEINPLVYQFLDDNPSYTINQTCSMILSDSFYYKQINYLFGDTDSILIEFSSRFFEQDGFQDKLFNLVAGVNQVNVEFFNNITPALTNLNSLVNDIRLNEYFPKIVNSLSSIDLLINQIDSDTSYLPSIDSSLSSILSSLSGLSSMGSDLASVKSAVQSSDGTLSNLYIHSFEYLGFLGQIEDHTELTDYRLQSIYTYLNTDLIDAIEKSTNVILDVVLPEFDFEYIGQDWDKFGDFVSDITVEFQGLDFTGFDTFTTDSRNFLNGLIDSNGLSPGFLNHLGDSYDFLDSKLDDFGWE